MLREPFIRQERLEEVDGAIPKPAVSPTTGSHQVDAGSANIVRAGGFHQLDVGDETAADFAKDVPPKGSLPRIERVTFGEPGSEIGKRTQDQIDRDGTAVPQGVHQNGGRGDRNLGRSFPQRKDRLQPLKSELGVSPALRGSKIPSRGRY